MSTSTQTGVVVKAGSLPNRKRPAVLPFLEAKILQVTGGRPLRQAPLLELLARDGWRRGLPEHITLATMRTDEGTCARMVCGRCRRKGLAAYPHRRGGRGYCMAGICPVCGWGELV